MVAEEEDGLVNRETGAPREDCVVVAESEKEPESCDDGMALGSMSV